MNNLLQSSEELIKSTMIDFQKMIKRYEKFPDEVRFLMLTDKLHLFLLLLKSVINITYSDEIRFLERKVELTPEEKSEKVSEIHIKIDSISYSFDLLKNELDLLENYIQSDSKSRLNSIETKMDELLLGPYYKSGIELMKNAQTDFNIKNTETK